MSDAGSRSPQNDSTLSAFSPAAVSHVFSMAKFTDAQLRQAISEVPAADSDEELVQIQVTDATGQHSALMRLDHPVRLHVDGQLGDYAFAFNRQADIRLTGSAGHGVGEGMASGAVRVRGRAGCGAGVAMTGGTLAIFGSAGHRCGAGMRSGSIFVRGNVGDETGVGALGGMIVIGGDAGLRLGDAMNNVTVFIRGKAKSLADGVTEAPLRKREELRLGLLLINASIRGDAKEFRRVVPEAMLKAEASQRGEVVPNWR
ncbi:tributyrin esterase [Novipirellula artificiosorum]|uniref:GXGXG motif protein n=1 Tax=Novipirellula artificiosorum TaxID=2528016 RepID=A0A5C6DGJ9_9BACT|nr:tributyrin esterase [Novipirellula artificiosorum]TWU35940.1 GXGXG motif protein [Novipirellula artificiosorum]